MHQGRGLAAEAAGTGDVVAEVVVAAAGAVDVPVPVAVDDVDSWRHSVRFEKTLMQGRERWGYQRVARAPFCRY